jgi:hypothetical protein
MGKEGERMEQFVVSWLFYPYCLVGLTFWNPQFFLYNNYNNYIINNKSYIKKIKIYE